MVVPDGVTTREPSRGTEPIPVITTLVAFVVVHESVDPFPSVMLIGLAESVQIGALGGGGGVCTVTVAEQWDVNPFPLTVMV